MDIITCKDEETAKRVMDKIGAEKIDDWFLNKDGTVTIKLNCRLAETNHFDQNKENLGMKSDEGMTAKECCVFGLVLVVNEQNE